MSVWSLPVTVRTKLRYTLVLSVGVFLFFCPTPWGSGGHVDEKLEIWHSSYCSQTIAFWCFSKLMNSTRFWVGSLWTAPNSLRFQCKKHSFSVVRSNMFIETNTATDEDLSTWNGRHKYCAKETYSESRFLDYFQLSVLTVPPPILIFYVIQRPRKKIAKNRIHHSL